MRKQAILFLTLSVMLSACSGGAQTDTAQTDAAQAGAGQENTEQVGASGMEEAQSGTAADEGKATKLDIAALTGTAMGMKGDIQVSVTMDGDTIAEITVTECVDTPVIRDAAIAAFPEAIVKQQNLDVDMVSGATMSCLGIKNAVSDALENGGIDVSAYQKGKTEQKEKIQGETQRYDLVIAGSGMAGLSAAIEAARNSEASILVLEKEAYTGGSSRVCGGGIWAVGSGLNQQIGQDSTLEEYVDFMEMRSETENLNLPLMKNIYEKSADVITYFYENGLPVTLDTWTLGHPDSKLPVLWAANGGEYDWETGNSGFLDAVQKMAEDLGVEIRLNSRVTELVAEDGTVTGVVVEDPEKQYTVEAGNVILATGGFTRNPDLVEQYAPEYTQAFAFTGAGSTGDGLLMTEALDTEIVGEGMMGLFGVNANFGYYGSEGNLVWLPQMYVNKEGKTFGLENAFYSDTLKMLLEQTDSQAYGIFDSTTEVTGRLDEAVGKKAAYRYDTLGELAADKKIDEAALLASASEKGLAEGPYYCVNVRPLFIGSIAGLKVDENCRVLTKNGDAIDHLYACGELIFGNVFAQRYPASGTGVATSAYTGAIAGAAVTEQ